MDNEKKCLSCADCGVMNCALRNGTYPEFCPTAALTEEEINEITKLYTNNRVNKKIAFPTARSASAFIIGLSVWFPTVVLTSSGISNVKKSYFEVGSALGTNTFWNIFKIAVSSAMPNIFLGLFNGICSSFVALMTAEMIGAKYGIGWYVNWQKEMMAYANVYAGLIVIAVMFFIVITLLFKVREKLLVWQKGVIKW